MSTIKVDAETAAKLAQCTTLVTVLDANGRNLGQFIPLTPLKEELSEEYARAMESCPHTPEELEAMRQEARSNPKSGRPLSEIWKSLGRT